jgi:dTDP-glucose 4,6-dehydratase
LSRIIVAGGAGLVGSHYCDRVLADGHSVICVDNMITGSPNNISHLLENDRFELIDHNISTPLETDGEFDIVINFASPASPIDYARYPIETLDAGSIGTRNTLDFAATHSARYILISTSEVYGDPLVSPQPETYWGNVNSIGPRSVYDEAKRFGEAYSSAYYREHGMDVRIARLFNTYGPRMSPTDGRAVPAFIGAALENKPVTVFGDGSQTRSICYVSDTVEGLNRLSTLDSEELSWNSPEGPPVVNIGNPDEITISQLAEEIIDMTQSDSEIVYQDLPIDDPMRRKPDITRAKSMLKWEPTVDRKTGLLKTIEYFASSKAKSAVAD